MDDAIAEILISGHLGVDVSRINDGARFVEDLGADSLDLLELTMLFEDRFGISVETEETEVYLTVADGLDLLRRKMRAAQTSEGSA